MPYGLFPLQDKCLNSISMCVSVLDICSSYDTAVDTMFKLQSIRIHELFQYTNCLGEKRLNVKEFQTKCDALWCRVHKEKKITKALLWYKG